MHRAAYHFINALHIPSLMKTKHTLQAVADSESEELEDNVDTSTEIEASSDDVAAMASTTMTSFEPGDVLGKILAFINQVRMSSEGVRAYLEHVCVVHQLKPIKLCLWVRTRWGSMSHCLESTLAIQKVSSYNVILFLFVLTLCTTKAIDYFCLAADSNEDLPPLKNKVWADYRLTLLEWRQVKLVHHCLKVDQQRNLH
jgi:hypothetical protein